MVKGNTLLKRTDLVNIPPSKRSGWLYKALVATVVVLAVIAAFVGAGLAIHYIVGLHHAITAIRNFFGKQITVGGARLGFGVAVVAGLINPGLGYIIGKYVLQNKDPADSTVPFDSEESEEETSNEFKKDNPRDYLYINEPREYPLPDGKVIKSDGNGAVTLYEKDRKTPNAHYRYRDNQTIEIIYYLHNMYIKVQENEGEDPKVIARGKYSIVATDGEIVCT